MSSLSRLLPAAACTSMWADWLNHCFPYHDFAVRHARLEVEHDANPYRLLLNIARPKTLHAFNVGFVSHGQLLVGSSGRSITTQCGCSLLRGGDATSEPPGYAQPREIFLSFP